MGNNKQVKGKPKQYKKNQLRSKVKSQRGRAEISKQKAAIAEKMQKRKMLKEQKAAEVTAERERIQREKEERIRNYKKKRLEKTKAISKRTKRGQPIMKDRMQLLLKQIEEMKRNGM